MLVNQKLHAPGISLVKAQPFADRFGYYGAVDDMIAAQSFAQIVQEKAQAQKPFASAIDVQTAKG
jgi:hypothetical protein